MSNADLQRIYEKLVKESEERERAIPLSLDLELKVFHPGLSRAVILDSTMPIREWRGICLGLLLLKSM